MTTCAHSTDECGQEKPGGIDGVSRGTLVKPHGGGALGLCKAPDCHRTPGGRAEAQGTLLKCTEAMKGQFANRHAPSAPPNTTRAGQGVLCFGVMQGRHNEGVGEGGMNGAAEGP